MANLLVSLVTTREPPTTLPKSWGAAENLGSPTFASILDQIAESAPSEHLSIGGAFESNGARFLAGTTRITPSDLSGVDGAALPFLNGGSNNNNSAT